MTLIDGAAKTFRYVHFFCENAKLGKRGGEERFDVVGGLCGHPSGRDDGGQQTEGGRRETKNGRWGQSQPFDRPMAALLVGFGVGMAACDIFPDHAYEAAAVALLAGAVLLHALRASEHAVFFPFLLFAGLGYLSLHPWTTSQFPADHFLHRILETPAPIVGTITETETPLGDRTRFRLRVEQVAEHSVSGSIRLTVAGLYSPQEGDRIGFTAKLYPVRTHRNPGGFDVRRYLRFSGIDGTAFVRSEAIFLLERRPAVFFRQLRSQRIALAESIDGTDGSDAAHQILKAVLIGIRSGISSETNDLFAATGLSHLLAISGLHVGIVAACAFFLFYRLAAFFKPLLLRAWGKKAAALLTLVPVFGYGLLAGMSPSTQRAVLMATIVLLGLLVERDHEPFNTLALAAWGILIVHPPALFSISFQLSFASVLAILAGTTLLLPHLPKPLGWRERLLLPIFVSACATIGTLPLVMFYFQRVSIVGLAANAVVVPMMSLLVIPIGLMGGAVHLLHLPGASLFFGVACHLLDVVLQLVRWLAAIPWASIVTIRPTVFELVWFGALLGLSFRTLRLRAFSRRSKHCADRGDFQKGAFSFPSVETNPPGAKPQNLFLRWAWVVVIVVGIADVGFWLNERFLHTDLRVTVLDVGQGLSLLVEEPGGRVMLIDGGGLPDSTAFDTGRNIVAPALCARKILSIDRVVLTHPDSDHLNGLLYVLSHFSVGELWTNGRSSPDPAYERFRDIVHRKSIPLVEGDTVPTVVNESGITMVRLHPDPAFLPPQPPRKSPDTNNFSLVLSLRMGEIGFLFPADIEKPAESWLVAHAAGRLGSTVLVAPHHGSKTSNSQAFIDAVRPDIVVFSAGTNRYIPHPDVLERYRLAGCRMVSTADCGAVMMRTDGRRLELQFYQPHARNEEIAIDGDV